MLLTFTCRPSRRHKSSLSIGEDELQAEEVTNHAYEGY